MLGIIGGTGIYQLDGLEVTGEHDVTTPYGKPSAPIVQGKMGGRDVFFLPRHGRHHELLPSEVNYRANIFALKKVGVTQVIGLSAVGSLQEEVAPGDLSLPDQYFDFIKGNREKTFFGEGLAAHVSTAEPTSKPLADAIEKAAENDVPCVSLAAAPAGALSGHSALEKRLRTLFFAKAGGHGLRQFKASFNPRWQPLYMAAPGWTSLALAAAELWRLVHRPPVLEGETDANWISAHEEDEKNQFAPAAQP